MYRIFLQTVWKKIISARALTYPVLVAIVTALLLMAIEYLTRVRFSASLFVTYVLYWLVVLLGFSILSTRSLLQYKREDDRFYVAMFLSGAFVGLLVALYKLLLYEELWTLFNVVAEPMRLALVSLVVAWVVLLREKPHRVSSSLG